MVRFIIVFGSLVTIPAAPSKKEFLLPCYPFAQMLIADIETLTVLLCSKWQPNNNPLLENYFSSCRPERQTSHKPAKSVNAFPPGECNGIIGTLINTQAAAGAELRLNNGAAVERDCTRRTDIDADATASTHFSINNSN